MVEEDHMKCMVCAQTRFFDKATVFLPTSAPRQTRQIGW